jgi:hypothetical protein
MGEFEGVNIIKLNGGTGRQPTNTDAVMAIAISTPVLPPGIRHNDVVETIQLSDIEDLGINEAYDANTRVLAHYHIAEFYRIAPEGKLYVTFTDETDVSGYFSDDDVKNAFMAMDDIKRVGFVYNSNDAVPTLDAEIAAAQLFVNTLAAEKVLIDGVYLEARAITSNSTNKRNLDAPNVSLVAFHDPAIAALHADYQRHAAVGTVLGSRAVRKVNEDLGSVDIINKPDDKKGNQTYPISDKLIGSFASVALSGGELVSTLSTAKKNVITANGYVYAGSYQGFEGVYLNTEPTCTVIESDYAFGNNNGVWNKAARGIRLALLPKVKSTLKRDQSTGNLKGSTVTALSLIAEKPIKEMIAADEISGGSVSIDPNQNPSDQTPFKVSATVVKDGIVFDFEVELGLR